MAKTKILLEIDCDEKMCGKCQYKLSHSTGLVGEFHPVCDVFDGHYGEWGARDMKRARRCIAASQNGATRDGVCMTNTVLPAPTERITT